MSDRKKRSKPRISKTPTRVKEERFVDSIINKDLGELAEKIGFSSNVFMIIGLPTQKLVGNPTYWTKKNSFVDLTLTRDKDFEIPYGCYARMNQIFIDTEVKTKCTNIIDVGHCFNDYIKKLDYQDGRANRALVRQLVNYCTSVIQITPKFKAESELVGLKTLISREYNLTFDVRNPFQLMLRRGFIRLDESYAEYIYNHAVPLDMYIVELFKRNPLGIDLYRFLAYRNNNLQKEISFPDRYLFENFCHETNIRKTRQRARECLRKIQTRWPVKSKFEDDYFYLAPSEPSVKKLSKTSVSFYIPNKPLIASKSTTDEDNISDNHPLLERILNATKDSKSISFYKKIIKSCSESSIVNALEDIETYRSSGRKVKNIGALFTSRIKSSNPDLFKK